MLYHIQSVNRTSSSLSSADFVIDLKNDFHDVKKATLLACNIHNTLYNVKDDTRSFIINDGSIKTATIPPGSYDVLALCSAIQTALNVVSSNFTVTYDSITMKITVSRTSVFSIIGTSSLRLVMGYSQVDKTGATTYTADNVVNLNPITTLFLQIQELSSHSISTCGTLFTYIIPLAVNSGEIATFSSGSFYHQTVELSKKTNISRLHVRLCSDNQITAELNGGEWSFTLRVD